MVVSILERYGPVRLTVDIRDIGSIPELLTAAHMGHIQFGRCVFNVTYSQFHSVM